jgi:hypothetical protein
VKEVQVRDHVQVLIKTLVEGRPDEQVRMDLAKLAARYPDEVLEELARRVGGEAVPDTVVALKAVEVILAALAYRRAKGEQRPLRVIASKDPVEGWQPLRLLLDEYAAQGMVHVYEVPMRPRVRPNARTIASQVARVARGFSARTVDVTDAPPYAVAALYSAGVRVLTVLVPLEHVLVFQKFSFTLPTH